MTKEKKDSIAHKIRNFTEKDQVRIKYSHIGADKKLMLSVYIGEDVYKELTGGTEYPKVKVICIPGDMVVLSPSNDEGINHRYNGNGVYKTTCIRISLGKYKNLKLLKRDFKNRVVTFGIYNVGDGKELKIDISSKANKKPIISSKTYVDNLGVSINKSYVDNVAKSNKNVGKWPVKLTNEIVDNIVNNYIPNVAKEEGAPILPLRPSLSIEEVKLANKHYEEPIYTNTKADSKPNKNPYIPRMEEKLDEIIKNQKLLEKEIIDLKVCNQELTLKLVLIINILDGFSKSLSQFDILVGRMRFNLNKMEQNMQTKSLFSKLFRKQE